MLHHMKLQPEPFALIREGRKIYELRLWDDKRQKLQVSDTVEFMNMACPWEKLRARVAGLHRFDSFAQLYQTLPLLQCGYTPENVDAADPADMERYYSRQEQQKWGVVAIELEDVTLFQDGDLTRTSRYLSLLLRHKPEAAGIQLDPQGWAEVSELIAGVNKTRFLNRQMLEYIVQTDEKQRYAFSEDGSKIRANQGHSVQVDVGLTPQEPPEYLWHGTAEKSVSSIQTWGLKPQSRLYVHLSRDYDTAVKVGSRHGKPVICRVRAQQMHRDGYVFYLSANRVWLTQWVPAGYLEWD